MGDGSANYGSAFDRRTVGAVTVDNGDIDRVAANISESSDAVGATAKKIGSCIFGPDRSGRNYRDSGVGFVEGHARLARVVTDWGVTTETLASDIRRSAAGYSADDGSGADRLTATTR